MQEAGIGVANPPPVPVVVVIVRCEAVEVLAGRDRVLDHAGSRADAARPEAGEIAVAARVGLEGRGFRVSALVSCHV